MPFFEISPGSISRLLSLWVLHQPVSKSIELIPLWRRWEPKPWQPSAQISVGRELAGDVRTHMQASFTDTHAVHKQIDICVRVLPNGAQPSRPGQIRMFIYWLLWLKEGFLLSHGGFKRLPEISTHDRNRSCAAVDCCSNNLSTKYIL